MNSKLTFLFLIFVQIGFSQQYDSVVIEEDSIDLNNKIYKPGSVFVYDYEIIINDKKYKLKKNRSRHNQETKKREIDFDLVPIASDSIGVDKIHLIVKPVEDTDRTNENQTQISYIEEPIFASFSSTGAVENNSNVWIHPIREGFFNSLETAPFPFIKSPFKIGTEWTDQMLIGEGWGNEMWGKWQGELLLTYTYKITDRKTIKTKVGEIDCFIIESKATSDIGASKLTSYFSEKYGFVRLEYQLLKKLKVNMWLVNFKTDVVFNDTRTFFMTKQYIKQ
jgi:hypothetical protein